MPDRKPRLAITYCRQCNWLLRAAWMAQELLTIFAEELGEVALVPGTGGVFEISCDGRTVWERKRDGGFPDAKTLKQRVRDLLGPGRDLGHADRQADAQ
jgi:selenoprotein W-related protein